MRPRGPSSSSPSSWYVGHVAVQKPQCTHARRIASASRPSGVSRYSVERVWSASGLQASGMHEPSGIEHAARDRTPLSACGGSSASAGSADGTRSTVLSSARNSVAWPPCDGRPYAQAGQDRRGRRAASQRSAPPHSISWSPPRSVIRRRRAARDSRQTADAPDGRVDEESDACWSRTPAQNASASALHARRRAWRSRPARRAGARQAHHEAPVVKARARYRQRLPAPFVGTLHRLVGRASRTRRSPPTRGMRHALERDLGDDAERAEGARHQARHVEAGDVLHHPAAERKIARPCRRGRLTPSTRVAHRAGIGTPRPGQPRRDGSRRASPPAAKRGGSNASIWPRVAHRASRSSDSERARARRDHELGRARSRRCPRRPARRARRLRARRRRSPWCRRRGCAAARLRRGRGADACLPVTRARIGHQGLCSAHAADLVAIDERAARRPR